MRLLVTLALLGGLLAVPAVPAAAAAAHYAVLFDDTKAETAGNADWILSTSMPNPTAQDATPSAETDWTGAISAWGVALQKTGNYTLATLPPSGSITYGNSSNPQDLSHYNEFVLPEPNILFTAAEKTAILNFVHAGGGLFMISDHSGSDRNNDGADSVQVLNGLMSGNPFGISIDSLNIDSENPHVVNSSDPVLNGPFGTVTGTIIRNGTTATLTSPARGEVFRTAVGTTGAAFATSTYGSGRVAFWGDSSPIDDGTGESGKTLYNGWDDPAGTDAALALNATQWLAGVGAASPPPASTPLADGGFESGLTGWNASNVTAASSPVHTGSASAAFCAANSCTGTLSQTFSVPAGASTVTFWTYVTTQETGTTAYDTLAVKVGSSTVATLSNTSTRGAWFSTTVAVSGGSATLSFTSTNGTKLPTSFWVDDVTVS